MRTFSRDDKAYIQWRKLHQDGFVFNDNKIHRAQCWTLDRKPKNARLDNPFTTMYSKTCACTEAELRTAVQVDRRCARC
jgi:hypothetical protein